MDLTRAGRNIVGKYARYNEVIIYKSTSRLEFNLISQY